MNKEDNQPNTTTQTKTLKSTVNIPAAVSEITRILTALRTWILLAGIMFLCGGLLSFLSIWRLLRYNPLVIINPLLYLLPAYYIFSTSTAIRKCRQTDESIRIALALSSLGQFFRALVLFVILKIMLLVICV